MHDAVANLILIEDALTCMDRMTKEEFVSCVHAEVRDTNALAWDEAVRMVAAHGTRRRALNHILHEIDKHR